MNRYQFSDGERLLMEKLRIPFAVYQFVNSRVTTLILSDGFCELFGYTDREQAYYDMDNDMYRETHPDDKARIAETAFRFAAEGGKYEVVYRTRKVGQTGYTVIHARGEHLYTSNGTQLAQVWYMDEGPYSEEMTLRTDEVNRTYSTVLHEESLLDSNYYDYLTGLPSMNYFFKLAAEGKDPILKKGGCPALLFMDMGGMKFFNRKYGFSEGNKLLIAFAELLVRYFSNENCSRFGEDHFVVYTDANGLEETLQHLFADCNELNEGRVLPVYVGIYLSRQETLEITTACDRAKLACDTLKNSYSSGYRYFTDEMLKDAERQQYIIDNLDRAIEEKWIKVYYQPIVRALNGVVCDEEALARWIDPVNGFLPYRKSNPDFGAYA